jgi:hypothetical protein
LPDEAALREPESPATAGSADEAAD